MTNNVIFMCLFYVFFDEMTIQSFCPFFFFFLTFVVFLLSCKSSLYIWGISFFFYQIYDLEILSASLLLFIYLVVGCFLLLLFLFLVLFSF